MNNEFDWSRDKHCVVVPEQLQIAVYENGDGNLVIRQAAWPDDDDWIVVAKAHVLTLCRALCDAAGIAPPNLQAALPAPKSSNADRQRKYRRNKRNAGDSADVTRYAKTVTRNADETQCNAVQPSLLDEAAE